MTTPTKFIAFTPSDLGIGVCKGDVVVTLKNHGKDAGLVPGVEFALVLPATEAREFAIALLRKADEAEAR